MLLEKFCLYGAAGPRSYSQTLPLWKSSLMIARCKLLPGEKDLKSSSNSARMQIGRLDLSGLMPEISKMLNCAHDVAEIWKLRFNSLLQT